MSGTYAVPDVVVRGIYPAQIWSLLDTTQAAQHQTGQMRACIGGCEKVTLGQRVTVSDTGRESDTGTESDAGTESDTGTEK